MIDPHVDDTNERTRVVLRLASHIHVISTYEQRLNKVLIKICRSLKTRKFCQTNSCDDSSLCLSQNDKSHLHKFLYARYPTCNFSSSASSLNFIDKQQYRSTKGGFGLIFTQIKLNSTPTGSSHVPHQKADLGSFSRSIPQSVI